MGDIMSFYLFMMLFLCIGAFLGLFIAAIGTASKMGSIYEEYEMRIRGLTDALIRKEEEVNKLNSMVESAYQLGLIRQSETKNFATLNKEANND